MKTISNRTKVHIMKIIGLLQKEGQMHVRGISRALEIHPMTVSRIIDSYLSPFLEINEINEFGLKAKIVKIREDKENITIEDILKYLEVKKKIRDNKTY
ncbi:MAG: hypothetical protein WA139_04645 [Candidatus Aenigmatarchaeota archaeon]